MPNSVLLLLYSILALAEPQPSVPLSEVFESRGIGCVYVLTMRPHDPANTKVRTVLDALRGYGLRDEHIGIVSAFNGQAAGDAVLAQLVQLMADYGDMTAARPGET